MQPPKDPAAVQHDGIPLASSEVDILSTLGNACTSFTSTASQVAGIWLLAKMGGMQSTDRLSNVARTSTDDKELFSNEISSADSQHDQSGMADMVDTCMIGAA